MALQEKLDRFRKQQDKCQTTLSSIAARSGALKVPTSNKPGPVPNGKLPPAVEFSNYTERLQRINSIRKAPVGAQMKRVLDLLLETRQGLTPEQINEHCYVDMKANKAVFESLRENPKLHYDGKRFSYKSMHDLKDKAELLQLVRRYPSGIAVIDLKDSYPTVMEDLQSLKAAGQIWLLSNFDSQGDVAYPNDPMVPPIKVDDDLKLLFSSIELPRDMLDIMKELQMNGMKPATNTEERSPLAQISGLSNNSNTKKKRQRNLTKRSKITNSHLPELFSNLNYD